MTSPRNPAMEAFIEEAMAVGVEDAFRAAGGDMKRLRRIGTEHVGPCPLCGGSDRFSLRPADNLWNCRGSGGGKSLQLIQHLTGCDFVQACEAVLGRARPDGRAEGSEERAAREAQLAERRAAAEADAARKVAADNRFRDEERSRARGILNAAVPLDNWSAAPGREYLKLRSGRAPAGPWLRFSSMLTYWHGHDGFNRARDLHCGPALVAPFMDASGTVIGCHQTWIDLNEWPKFRPCITDPDTGELLPTKKMRGTKKGGLIPLAGDLAATRWVGGEGIETTLRVACAEQFRADTFYFAAGDLGNLSGPADQKSRYRHPTIQRPDKNGVLRPTFVAGPVPRPGSDEDAAPIPEHVRDLRLLADGDSERVMTAAAMVRAEARFARPGRTTFTVWPAAAADFADIPVPA